MYYSKLKKGLAYMKKFDAIYLVILFFLKVIDTPGVFDPDRKPDEVEHEILRCLLLSSPGPHALLFVLKGNERFTPEEQGAYNMLRNLFASHLINFIIFVFTQGDEIGNEFNFEHCPKKVQDIVQQAGKRLMVVNNRAKNQREKDEQVLNLLDRKMHQWKPKRVLHGCKDRRSYARYVGKN
jgi:GTPase Era involved in 16S rRNA processing